jgi:hypothetical protein
MYHKTQHVTFVKTRISIQIQVQIDTSVVQNDANSKACAQQGIAQSSLIKVTMTMALLAIINNKPQK